MDRKEGPGKDDKSLMAATTQEEAKTFESVIKLHMKWAYNFAYRLSQDHFLAEELSQESFIALYQGWKRFRGESSLRTYLGRIIINLWHRYLKRKKKQDSLRIFLQKNLPGEKEIPEKAFYMTEKSLQLKQAIEKLPARQKEVFILRCVEGMKISEVASLLHCQEGTVKANLFFALEHLKEYLKK